MNLPFGFAEFDLFPIEVSGDGFLLFPLYLRLGKFLLLRFDEESLQIDHPLLLQTHRLDLLVALLLCLNSDTLACCFGGLMRGSPLTPSYALGEVLQERRGWSGYWTRVSKCPAIGGRLRKLRVHIKRIYVLLGGSA